LKKKIDFFVKFPCSEWKFAYVYQIWSKSDNSQLRFANSAIFKMAAVRHLEFAKIAVLVSDVYRHVILHFRSKFRVDRPLLRRELAKNHFQYGVRRPSWTWKISIFVKLACSECKFVSVYQIRSKLDNSQLRFANNAIFNMVFVRHLAFVVTSSYCIWKLHFTFTTLC